ncbi:IS200/IS605 family element RNA-guided endonuclease TnpB (plasmid) [Deinococcus radiomollis]|uniref:IS200/IS605 family element RNA-guided endonuclease TnpB n=1 Tax=Deinococcus radiomollis TaxID=468916 RepID=UPI003891A873
MLRQKAFKVRLCPTAEQATQINKTIGSARYVYNRFLARRQAAYKDEGTSLNYQRTSSELTQVKKDEETLWLKEVDKFSLQNSLKDLDRAYQNFFQDCKKPKKERKFRYPKFHSKRGRKQSYRTNQTNGNIAVQGDALKLPRLGWIKFRKSQEIHGRIINVTVRRNATGKYFASVQVEVDVQPLPLSKQAVGLDLGIKTFLIPSEGEPVGNPKHYRANLRRLKRASRVMSRRVKGSNRRQRAKTKLAKTHERIANLRRDFLQKLSTTFVRQYGVICIEDLRVSNMVRNHSLAQSIMDAGWGEFRRQLEYKAAWYGRKVIAIDAFFPSSQRCHDCGFKNPAVKNLSVREWTCPNCNETHDRDLNAALNIRDEGLKQLAKAVLPAIDGGLFSEPLSSKVTVAAGMTDTLNARGEGLRPAKAGSFR